MFLVKLIRLAYGHLRVGGKKQYYCTYSYCVRFTIGFLKWLSVLFIPPFSVSQRSMKGTKRQNKRVKSYNIKLRSMVVIKSTGERPGLELALRSTKTVNKTKTRTRSR